MKRLLAGLVCMVMVMCVFLCPAMADASVEGKRIACIAGSNEWNHNYMAEVAKLCEERGWTYQQFDSAGDVNEEINMVNSIIAQQFDAMLIQPAQVDALAPAMRAAAEAGVVVVSHYNMENQGLDDVIYQALFDEEGAGILEATTFVEMFGETAKVAIIAGSAGGDGAQRRAAGMQSVFANYPGIEVVQIAWCDWSREKAMAAAEDIITAHPDLDAFLTELDSMSWGVYEALEAAGKTEDIKIASCEFYESSIEAIKDGKFMFSISYPASTYADCGFEMLDEIFAGKTLDQRVRKVGMTLVTVDNVDVAPHD